MGHCLFSKRLLRKSGRILHVMFTARRSYTAWFLRLAAFVLFISGGALAQRYLTAQDVIQSLPLEQRDDHTQVAVLLETTRKIEFADGFAASAPPTVQPFALQLEDAPLARRAKVVRVAVSAPRAFDALAPPQHG